MATTQNLTELPSIQYTGMDYASVISEIKTIIENNPNWQTNWTNFYNSEAGTMLVQLMAWICDNLTIRQDLLYNEHFISTANNRVSKVNLLKQIGYYTKQAVAATVPVKISLDSTLSGELIVSGSSDAKSSLPETYLSFEGKDINGRSTQYEILGINSEGVPDYIYQVKLVGNGGSEFSEDSNGNKLIALQGKTYIQEFTADTRDGPYFDLPVENIAYNSIRIYDMDEGMLEHKRVDSFLNIDVRNSLEIVPRYIIERNNDNHVRIRYPSEKIMTYDGIVLDEVETISGRKHRMFVPGHTVRIYYRTTDGNIGNIPENFINTEITLSDADKTSSISAVVNNYSTGYGGKDSQTLDEALTEAPAELKTVGRAVTAEDYDTIISNSSLILKSKTYSPSNQPNNFVDYYGRRINPQEVFTFALMNKNFDNITSEDYNKYPWIDTNRMNILNEKYVFGEAEMNLPVRSVSETFQSYYLYNKEQSSLWLRNGTIIQTEEKIKEAIQSDDKKAAVRVKIHKRESDESYVASIPCDLMSSSIFDEDILVENIMSNLTTPTGERVSDDCLSNGLQEIQNNNVSAHFVSNAKLTEGEPLDCLYYKKINITLDNIVQNSIDLMVEKESGKSYTAYYLLLDNEPIDDPTITDISSKEYAKKRYGIKQLINNQMIGLTTGPDVEYRLFDGHHAYQQLDLNLNTMDGEGTGTLQTDGYYIMKIFDGTYAFKIGADAFEKSKDYYYNLKLKNDSGIVDTQGEYRFVKSADKKAFAVSNNVYYNYEGGIFSAVTVDVGDNVESYYQKTGRNVSTSANVFGLNAIVDQLEYEFNVNTDLGILNDNLVYKLTEKSGLKSWELYDTTELSELRVDCINKINYDTGYNNDQNDNFNGNSNCYDMVIATRRLENEELNKITRILSDSDNIDTASLSATSFLKAVKNSSEDVVLIEAYKYSYNEIAFTGMVNEKYSLVIKSPITGLRSSLFFTHDGGSREADIMQLFGLEFGDDNRSEKAVGQKRLIFYLSDCMYATKNTTSSSGEQAETPSYGDVLYVDNEINHVFRYIKDIVSIKNSYRLSDANSISIDKYDNFKCSDNEETNKKMKPKFICIDGASVYSVTDASKNTKYYIDKNKSNFDVRLTKTEAPTNSLYSIDKKEQLRKMNIVENDRTIVTTAVIKPETAGSKISTSEVVPLVFSIDDLNTSDSFDENGCLFLDVGTTYDLSGEVLYNSFMSYLKAYSLDNDWMKKRILPNNIYTLCNKVPDFDNKLIFSGLLKNNDGKVAFYYPEAKVYSALSISAPADINECTKHFYKKMFGTSRTNPDFYALFPREEMLKINNENIVITNILKDEETNSYDGDLEDGEYYYSPTEYGKALIFKYREYSENEKYSVTDKKVSRWGDYFIDFDGTDFDSGYSFKIVKTDVSNVFPDSYFYLHFLNDRTFDPARKNVENGLLTDEDALQNYIENKKIISTEVNFLKPYFRTFDIEATITYDPNFSLDNVKKTVESKFDEEFSLKGETINIGNSISKSKIYQFLLNIDGVRGVNITYFGLDYNRQKEPGYENQDDEIKSDFYEITSLYTPDDAIKRHGKMFSYKKEGAEGYSG